MAGTLRNDKYKVVSWEEPENMKTPVFRWRGGASEVSGSEEMESKSCKLVATELWGCQGPFRI